MCVVSVRVAHQVTPENCMVTGAGVLKVADLGLATVGSLVVASPAEEGEAGGINSADVAARLGGCSDLYTSPEVKALQKLPTAPKCGGRRFAGATTASLRACSSCWRWSSGASPA